VDWFRYSAPPYPLPRLPSLPGSLDAYARRGDVAIGDALPGVHLPYPPSALALRFLGVASANAPAPVYATATFTTCLLVTRGSAAAHPSHTFRACYAHAVGAFMIPPHARAQFPYAYPPYAYL